MKAIKHVSVLKITINCLVLPTKLQMMGAVRMPLVSRTPPVKDVFAVVNPKGTRSDPSRLPKAAKTPISIAKEASKIIKFELFASLGYTSDIEIESFIAIRFVKWTIV